MGNRIPTLAAGQACGHSRLPARCGGIPYHLLDRSEIDVTRADSVRAAIDTYRPWAVVNATGYTRVDEAEVDEARCYTQNAHGAGVPAAACARRGIPLLTFSSDLVFGDAVDGMRVESTPVSPCSVYGSSKVRGERRVRRAGGSALIVRLGPIFGAGDDSDELTRALRMLAIGAPVIMPSDEVVSPTYLPDLVHASLDLLIDGEHGIWHLANRGEASLYQMVKDAAVLAEVSTETLRAVSRKTVQHAVLRPACRALSSERGEHLPWCKVGRVTPVITYLSL